MSKTNSSRKSIKLILIVAFISIFISISASVFALQNEHNKDLKLGVTPSRIIEKHLLPGQTITKTIVLSTNKDDILVRSSWDSKFISLKKNITIKNKQKINIKIIAPYNEGTYQDKILFLTKLSDLGQFDYDISVPVYVSITVNRSQFTDASLNKVRLAENRCKKIEMTILNRGNSKGNDVADIEIYDKFRQNKISKIKKTIDYLGFKKTIRQIRLPFLKKGDYWVDVTFRGDVKTVEFHSDGIIKELLSCIF